MTGFISDDAITDHAFTSEGGWGASCQHMYPGASFGEPGGDPEICGQQAMVHANPGDALARSLVMTSPHDYQNTDPLNSSYCTYTASEGWPRQVCGYPENQHGASTRTVGEAARTAAYPPWGTTPTPERSTSALPVRMADVAQYQREPMPDQARGKISVTLVDAPVDPFGTLAAICGIYEGKIRRSKAEVTDEQRRDAWTAMRKTMLSGPLEAMQLTFLIEGLDRAITHQLVRNRFAFVAQESLRFAVAEDWAAEVALPPALLGRKDDDPLVSMWRRGLNAAEDSYAALVAAGLPAEEARGLLPHAIPTRLFWTVSVRTMLMEAGKRTCTQAQFPWRLIFAGVAKALRERGQYAPTGGTYVRPRAVGGNGPAFDGWQFEALAQAIEPVCYQTGRCGFMAAFDRGCTIRSRVDAFAAAGVPSSEWDKGYAGKGLYEFEGQDAEGIPAINRAEWLADPSAARVTEG